MKKKILEIGVFIILVSMLMILTGCGNEEQQESKDKKTTQNSLASVVKVGDYVDYKTETDKTIKIEKEKSGSDTIQTFKTTGDEKWRVLNINDDGTVELISEKGIATSTNQKYITSGVTGYYKYVDTLNEISALYGTGKFAKSARSLNLEDIYNLIGWENIANYFGIEYTGEASKEEIYLKMNSRYGSDGTVTNSKNIYFPSLSADANENGYITQSEFEVKSDFKIKCEDSMRGTPLNIYNNNEIITSLLEVDSYVADTFIDYEKPSPAFPDNDTSIVWGVYYLSDTASKAYIWAKNYAWNYSMGYYDYKNSGYTSYIRPVVTIDANTKCKDGSGTETEPYTLDN